MKDFRLRNDTVLLFRNEPVDDIMGFAEGKKVLFGSTYRKSLTSLFPGFLKVMAAYHQEDIRKYFRDVFGYEGSISESADMMRDLFEQIGVDMYFDGELSREAVGRVATGSCLSQDELYEVLKGCMR